MKTHCCLSNKRYEEIKEIVADMYEDLGYKKLPIDVFELCNRLRIKVIKYSELSTPNVMNSRRLSDDGYNLFNVNTNQYEIYYNDIVLCERTSFTIMHEIGHIMLEHTSHAEINEQEANFFAKTALAPLGVIYKLKLRNALEVAKTFGLSMEFSENIVKHYNRAMIFPSIAEKEVKNRLTALFNEYYVGVS